MAKTWEQVTKADTYLRLPDEERMNVKRDYWQKRAVPKLKKANLNEAQIKEAHEEFFGVGDVSMQQRQQRIAEGPQLSSAPGPGTSQPEIGGFGPPLPNRPDASTFFQPKVRTPFALTRGVLQGVPEGLNRMGQAVGMTPDDAQKQVHQENVHRFSKVYGVNPEFVEKNYVDFLPATARDNAIKSIIYAGLGGVHVGAKMLAGLTFKQAALPLVTYGAALSAIDAAGLNLDKFLPSDATQAGRSTVELLDLVGKSVAITGGIKFGQKQVARIEGKAYTNPKVRARIKKKIHTMKGAETVKLDVADLQAITSGKGEVSAAKLNAYKTVATLPGARLTKGGVLEIPSHELVRLVDKPYWNTIRNMLAMGDGNVVDLSAKPEVSWTAKGKPTVTSPTPPTQMETKLLDFFGVSASAVPVQPKLQTQKKEVPQEVPEYLPEGYVPPCQAGNVPEPLQPGEPVSAPETPGVTQTEQGEVKLIEYFKPHEPAASSKSILAPDLYEKFLKKSPGFQWSEKEMIELQDTTILLDPTSKDGFKLGVETTFSGPHKKAVGKEQFFSTLAERMIKETGNFYGKDGKQLTYGDLPTPFKKAVLDRLAGNGTSGFSDWFNDKLRSPEVFTIGGDLTKAEAPLWSGSRIANGKSPKTTAIELVHLMKDKEFGLSGIENLKVSGLGSNVAATTIIDQHHKRLLVEDLYKKPITLPEGPLSPQIEGTELPPSKVDEISIETIVDTLIDKLDLSLTPEQVADIKAHPNSIVVLPDGSGVINGTPICLMQNEQLFDDTAPKGLDTKNFGLALKLALKLYRFTDPGVSFEEYFGGQERMISFMKKEVLPDSILGDMSQIAKNGANLMSFTNFKKMEVKDIFSGLVRNFANAELPNGSRAQRVHRAKGWDDLIQHANQEIYINEDGTVAWSDFGLESDWQSGQMTQANTTPFNPSEANANVEAASDFYEFVYGKEPPEALVNQWRSKKPQGLFFNMLPQELKEGLVWGKTNVEEVLLKEQIDATIFSRTDIQGMKRAGWTKGQFDFIDDAHKKTYNANIFKSGNIPQKTFRTHAEFVKATGMETGGAGLVAVSAYSENLGTNTEESLNRIYQQRIIGRLKSVANPSNPDLGLIAYEGDPIARANFLATGEKPSAYYTRLNYSMLKDAPGLIQHYHGAFEPPWVHNTVANLLRDHYKNVNDSAQWVKTLIGINGIAKRTIMAVPYQYLLQIISSSWVRNSLAQNLKSIKALASLPYKVLADNESFKAWKKGLSSIPLENYQQDAVKKERYIKAGATALVPEQVFKQLFDSPGVQENPKVRSDLQEITAFIFGKGGLDREVFSKILPNFMFDYIETMETEFLKKGHSLEESTQLAVDFANSTSGIINKNEFASQGERDFLQLFWFARNLTVSLAQQLTGATYPGWKKGGVKGALTGGMAGGFIGGVPGAVVGAGVGSMGHSYKTDKMSFLNSLMHGSRTEKQMDVLWKYYAGNLARIWMWKMLFNGFVQRANWEKAKMRGDNPHEDRKWIFKNPKNRVLQIWTGESDPDGNPIYQDPLFFREATQMLSMSPEHLGGRGITQFISNKLSWGMKRIQESAGKDYKDDPISSKEGGEGYPAHIAKSVGPSILKDGPPGVNKAWWMGSAAAGFPLRKGQRGEKQLSKAYNALRKKSADDLRRKRKLDDMTVSEVISATSKGEIEMTGKQLTNYIFNRKMKLEALRKRNKKALFEYGGF